MKLSYALAVATVLVLERSCPVVAQPAVWEFNSIEGTSAGHALRKNNVLPTFAAHVAAYYCSGSCPNVLPDGGEGLFVAGRTCLARLDDGGSLIVDSYTAGRRGDWYLLVSPKHKWRSSPVRRHGGFGLRLRGNRIWLF